MLDILESLVVNDHVVGRVANFSQYHHSAGSSSSTLDAQDDDSFLIGSSSSKLKDYISHDHLVIGRLMRRLVSLQG